MAFSMTRMNFICWWLNLGSASCSDFNGTNYPKLSVFMQCTSNNQNYKLITGVHKEKIISGFSLSIFPQAYFSIHSLAS